MTTYFEHSIPSTERIYYKDAFLETMEAVVLKTGSDETFGSFVIFNKTLFHPQGGGQPSDIGFVSMNGHNFPVIKLVESPRDTTPNHIFHYFGHVELPVSTGDVVIHIIDLETRIKYSRLHSAGHLLANAVKLLFPEGQPGGSSHVAGESYVNFRNLPLLDQDQIVNIFVLTNKLVSEKLEAVNKWETVPRTHQFGSLQAYPCRGTHVNSTETIGKITFRSAKVDKKTKDLKLGYDIEGIKK